MNGLFNSEIPVFQFIYKLVLMILTGVLAMTCALPLLTMGPSLTALYETIQKAIVKEEGYVLRTFFKSFRKNFKDSFLCGLILILYLAFVGTGTYLSVILTRETAQMNLLQYVLGALLLPVVLIFPYLFPLISKFVYSVKEYLIVSFYLSIKHLANSILFSILIYGGFLVLWIVPQARLFAFAFPGIVCYLVSLQMENIFESLIKK